MDGTPLLDQFLSLLDGVKGIFKDSRTRGHVREMGVASIVADSPKTITSLVEFNGRHGSPELNHDNWSASYRMLSTGKWEQTALSWALLEMALGFVGEDDPVILAVDDTLLGKRGHRIPGCAYARDPLSPPFQANLVWGQRMLCVSILIRSSATSAYRSIPLFFILTPSVRIPSRASDEEKASLVEFQKKGRMSVVARSVVDMIRRHLDEMGLSGKKLVVCGDASFANRAFMYAPSHDTAMVCRCRSDIRLLRPLRKEERKGKRLYGERLPTPAEFGRDGSRTEETLDCGAMHQHAKVAFRSMNDVRWPTALKNQPCAVVVIRGQYYRKYGKKQHTDPAYLVMTGDVKGLPDEHDAMDKMTGGVPREKLIEAYLLRWEIEVGFRDQKNWLGIGKAQVRNEASVKRTPAFMSACYAMLLMATMKLFDDKRTEDFKPLPKWRSIAPQRPSIRDMVELLKREVLQAGRVAA